MRCYRTCNQSLKKTLLLKMDLVWFPTVYFFYFQLSNLLKRLLLSQYINILLNGSSVSQKIGGTNQTKDIIWHFFNLYFFSLLLSADSSYKIYPPVFVVLATSCLIFAKGYTSSPTWFLWNIFWDIGFKLR